ncbi:MAG: hypothetical protein R6V50_01695 [Thermoplasmatota archaeon]
MMILIVFFILLIFALVFFIRFQQRDAGVQQQQYNEREMVETAQEVYSLGEFGCSYDNTLKYDCVDMIKLEAFKHKMLFEQSYLFYRKLIGNVRVELEEIYPKYKRTNYTGENAVYDAFPKGNEPSYRYSERAIQIPVVLYNATDSTVGSYYFGIMTVTSYFRVFNR